MHCIEIERPCSNSKSPNRSILNVRWQSITSSSFTFSFSNPQISWTSHQSQCQIHYPFFHWGSDVRHYYYHLHLDSNLFSKDSLRVRSEGQARQEDLAQYPFLEIVLIVELALVWNHPEIKILESKNLVKYDSILVILIV